MGKKICAYFDDLIVRLPIITVIATSNWLQCGVLVMMGALNDSPPKLHSYYINTIYMKYI